MKKIIAAVLCVLMVIGLCACGKEAKQEGTVRVVATIFPLYDWTKQVVGDTNEHVDVRLLLDRGVDMHSYQPSVDDIMLIADCDVFIYVGGESDAWVTDALRQATNKDMVVVNLMERLGDRAKTEETVEGMQADEDEHEDEGEEYDEHIWLSLKNGVFCCEQIRDALCRADSAHADGYRTHTADYCEKLTALDDEYQKAVGASSAKTLLFGDRFPFRYLVEDYGIRYYAAFAGCSAETEASFETIVFLANKVDELGLKNILVTESADGSVAATIRENTKTKNQTILTLDSMQSVTAENISSGTSYYKVMQDNLSILRQALA